MLQDHRFFNRDLSWLSFNYRVLIEARDTSLPLFERIKFLAIYSSNLNEFFRVRVASIQSLRDVQPGPVKEQDKVLADIYDEVSRQQDEFGSIFREQILPELERNNIFLIQGPPRDMVHQEYVTDLFMEEVRAFLHPELLRKDKIVHFLRDGALYHVVKLRNKPKRGVAGAVLGDIATRMVKKRVRYALIQVPTHYFPRFIVLPRIGDAHYIMFLDDVIRYNLERIFPGYIVLSCYSVKVNRNADLLIEDEFSGDLVEKISESLKRRRIGIASRFLYDQNMPASMLRYLRDTFGIAREELMTGGTYHNFMDFFSFPNPLAPQLERVPMPPLPHADLESYSLMLAAIGEQNRLLHYPYQSYDYVIRFLNQSAIDPDVKEIYTTQYRVASNSAVVQALIRAAQNGKKVTVFVEIKARFDEAHNLTSAREMEQAGVRTIYSIPGLKVHAKVALVMRQEGGRMRGYAYLSTGNFNEKTARLYTDHGYFTADQEVIQELQEVFAYLNDQAYVPREFKHLLVAPFNMRRRFVEMIEREAAHARAGKPADILIKLNNLEDERMIEKLYEASQAGVRIRLIVRGICCLRPGVPGLSDHITVTRIVDQYLEHARAFVFHNAGANELYLGSADWMQRNLSRRVEVIFPVTDGQLKSEIFAILKLQLSDNVKATRLDADMVNHPIRNDNPPLRVQHAIYGHLQRRTLLDILQEES
ncbi:MAG: polyphosphate kinase 1 [Bacteroidia bacterium]|nr:polyphosphate kinase 1 [Bacteroidia bacterium]